MGNDSPWRLTMAFSEKTFPSKLPPLKKIINLLCHTSPVEM
jgi:hypothetical protein